MSVSEHDRSIAHVGAHEHSSNHRDGIERSELCGARSVAAVAGSDCGSCRVTSGSTAFTALATSTTLVAPPHGGRFVAAASLALTLLGSIACQRKAVPLDAPSTVPARVDCAGGRQIVREGLQEWCALSDGTRDGQFVSFADETLKAVEVAGQYENGKESGRWATTYGGVVHNESHYRNGVHHGPRRANYSNGAPELRGEYSEGQMHGEWTWWHANGAKKAIARYVNGRKFGRSEAWDAEGRVTSSIDHQAGEMHGRYFVSSTESMLQVEGVYVHGLQEGRWVWTHLSRKCRADGYEGSPEECGRPESTAKEGNYVGGRREGLWKSFYWEGPLSSQGAYRNDKKEGVWRYFSFEGKPSEVISCRSGHAHGPYWQWQELDLAYGNSPVHHLALSGRFRDGQPIGAWRLSYPGLPAWTSVCKADEPCETPGMMLWSDVTRGCETIELQVL